MKTLARKTALAILTLTLLIGAFHQWFWFNWHLMSRVGAVAQQWEKCDNRLEKD